MSDQGRESAVYYSWSAEKPKRSIGENGQPEAKPAKKWSPAALVILVVFVEGRNAAEDSIIGLTVTIQT